MPPRSPATGRSARKRAQILEGARATFNEHGFERASVDEVAGRAGVSKATVYNHFKDKRCLFLACFSEDVDARRAEVLALLGPPGGDLPAALQRLGERLVRFMASPEALCLYRHTMGESARFPELGATLFERGPSFTYDTLAGWLEGWQAGGHLQLEDARAAAVQFVMLCQGELLVRAQLAVQLRPSDAQVRQTVARAVRTFLRAYAPADLPRPSSAAQPPSRAT